MDYNEIIEKLNLYTETHPNITTIWKHYMQIKRESYQKALLECETAINFFTIQSDLNIETVLLL